MFLDRLFPLHIPDEKSSFSQIVLASDGQTLRAFADESGIWRQAVKSDNVASLYLEALLAYEDRGFWYHPGVNPVALLRAFWLNGRCGCIVSGGSTLTMQVARILHPHTRTIPGKLYQILRAFQLELHYSKSEILALYLHYAPFGGTVEGIEAASHAYLDKPAKNMTHAEAALMAVLPQSPSRIRPDRYPEKALLARNKVLQRLLDLGYWDAATVAQAKMEPVIADKPLRPNFAPLLSRALRQKYPDDAVIKTTVNFDIQQGIEDQLKGWIQTQPKQSSAAVVVIDNKTLDLLAYIGSADFSDQSRFGHVDMVTAVRSPGSTLKPFIYGIALDKGLIHSKSLLSDAPRYFSEYKPQNFSQHFSGPVSVTDALQRSLNVPAVQVLSHLGPKYFHARMASAGIRLVLPDDSPPNLAIALGGTGVSLWDLVTAYAALSRGGQVQSIRVLTDEKSAETRFLLSESAAWITHKMLSDNARPGRIQNENVRASENDIAWKTGTSYGYRDAWAIGSSKNITVGVWLGRPDGTPLPGHFGALNAAPLMFNLADALQGYQSSKLKKPPAVTLESICWPLGIVKSATADHLCHQSQEAWLIDHNAPQTFNESKERQWLQNPTTLWLNQETGLLVDMDCDVKRTRLRKIALWPKNIEPWLAYRHTRRGQIPRVDDACEALPQLDVGAIKIAGIEPGNIVKAVRKGKEKPMINLQAIGGVGARDWFVNGRFIYSAGEKQVIPYQFKKLGIHQIVVVDQQGDSDRVEIIVEEGQ